MKKNNFIHGKRPFHSLRLQSSKYMLWGFFLNSPCWRTPHPSIQILDLGMVMPDIAHIGPNCIASNPLLGLFDTKTIWPGQIYQVAHPRANCNRCHYAGMKTSCPRVVTSSMGHKTGKVCHCMPNGGAYTPSIFLFHHNYSIQNNPSTHATQT